MGGQAGGGELGCLPRLLNPAETTVLPAQTVYPFLPVPVQYGEWGYDPGWGLMTLGSGVPR